MDERLIYMLIIGFLFVIISLFIMLFKQTKKWIRFFFLIPLLIGISLVYIVLFGPLRNSESHLKKLERLDCSLIDSIRFMPSHAAKSGNFNLEKTIVIRERNELEKACIALQLATKRNSKNTIKRPELKARVEVFCKNHALVAFGIETHGLHTEIVIGSSGESGWIYGQLDGNEFGQFFNRIVRKTD
jgi:hypothetical protein